MTSVSVSAALSDYAGNPSLTALSIADTSANIAANIDDLELMALAGKITSITQTGTVSPLNITSSQLTNDAAVLAAIIGGYTLNVSGVVASGTLAVLLANPNVVSLAVSDTGANISAGLDGLQALGSKLTGITQTDTAALTITATQAATDAGALSKISGSYSVTVSDSSAHIASNLDALQVLFANPNVTFNSLTQTGTLAPLTLSVAQLTTDAGVLAKLSSYTVAISDSSAHIAAGLDALQALLLSNKLAGITQTSPAAPLSISITQLSTDSGALAKIVGSYTLAITDTSANIATNLNALQAVVGKVASVTQASPAAALTLSVAQLTTDASILAKIVGGYTVAISDSGAHISAGLDALQALGGKLANITQNDGAALALTAVQAASDAVALGKISGSYSVTVSDSSAHIASNLDALQVLFANPNVTFNSLTQTGTLAPLTLSVAQLTTDAGVLAKLSSYTVAISDSSAHIAAGLDALQALLLSNKLAGITQTSPAAPLSISITQLSTDSGALAKIAGSYTLAITDTSANIATNLNALQAVVGKVASVTQASPAAALTLSVAQLTTDASILAKIVGGYTVAISDSGAHISAGLDALQALGGKLANITQNDGAALALTAVQAASDAVALGKISGSYSVTVSDSSAHIASNLDALQVLFANPNVTFNSLTQTGTLAPLTLSVAQLTTDAGVLAKLSSYTVAISDSSAHIAAGLDALQALLLSNKLAGITQTSPAAPLSISITQLSTDSGALAKIVGSYTLAITDTSANIATNLNALQAVVGKVASVTQASPAAALTLSVAQLTTDASILAKIVGGYTVAISDSGAHISAGLDALQALGGKLANITQNDGAALALTAVQAVSDAVALGKISGSYSVTVSDSSAHIASNLDALQVLFANPNVTFNSLTQTGTLAPLTLSVAQLTTDAGVLAKLSSYTVAISDSSAHIAAGLDALQALLLSNKLAGITQTSPAAPLSISITQLSTDSGALAKIVGSYTLAITDTSANIATNLNALQAVVGKVASVTQASPAAALTLSVAQLTTDASILAKIVGGYTVAISDSGAHISAGLDALQALGGKLANITQNDGAALALTAVQAASDAVALGKISGSYSVTVSDSSAHIASNLDALQVLFANPNVTFNSLTQTGTLAPLTLSVAQLTTDAGVLAKLSSYTVAISDSSAHIAAGLDALQALLLSNKLAGITQTSPAAPLSISITQLSTDSGALAKIVGSYTLAITDTSANIATNLNALQAVVGKVASVTQASPAAALTLSVAQLTTDASILAKIVGGYTVAISDSGAHISAGLDALQALGGKLANITQNDGAALALTAVQAASDAVALGKISGSYSVTVSDSSAHIASNLDALQVLFANPNVTFNSLTQTGTLAPLTLSVAQLTTDAGVLAKLSSYTVAISDSSAHIAAGLDALQALLLSNKLAGITQTSPAAPLSISITQLSTDSGALAKIAGSYTLAITDTSANIATNLNALQAVVGKVASVTQASPAAALTLSVAQLTTDASILAKIVGGYTVAISDSGAHISAGLDALQALGGKLANITQNDGAALALTAVQAVSDAVALGKISGSYSVTVSDSSAHIASNLDALQVLFANPNVTFNSLTQTGTLAPLTLSVAQLTTDAGVLAKLSSYTVAISDSSAHIAAGLDALQALLLSNKLAGITQTSPAAPLSISITQLSTDSGALAKIAGSYTLAITDTSANIATNLNALQAVVGKVASVTQASPAAALTLSVAQLTTDASILAKIVGGYTVAISDSGAHISAGLDALQALGGKLANITQNDGAALALTAVQAVSDAVALGKISGSYSVTVSDSSAHIASNLDALQVLFANPNVTFNSLTQTGTLAPLTLSVAQLTTDAGVLAKLSSYTVAISDSSAHIAAGLDALQALLLSNKLAGITQTSPAAPLSISITQLSTDSGALAKIVGSYTLAITDTSANIATNLNALQAVVGKVASVTQASPAAALTLSVAQLTTDASILAKIVGGYTVAISDSGAHISAGLDALQALGGKLANITQNDGAALALTAVQAASDAVALGKISGSYSVTVSDSSAHIASNLDALQVLFANPNVTFNSLTQTGTLAPLTLSVAQLTTDAGVLAKLSSYTVAISDSSAHIAAGLDALQALLLSNKLAGITQTSPAAPLSISITQLSTDSGALAKIVGSYTLAITDTSANIATNLNALQAVVGKVASVTQASPAAALTLSVAQLTTDASILAKIVGGYTVAISDSGAHISAGLDALQALGGKLANITQNDGAALALTAVQAASDAVALGKISGSYSVTVSDSSAHIASNLDALQVLFANPNVTFNSLTQTGTLAPLTLSVAQLTTDAGVLAKLSSYTVAISDSSAHIAAGLDALQALLLSNKLAGITQTSPAAPLSISITQLSTDSGALAKIAGSYTLAITDTSANIATNLNALQAVVGKVASVTQASPAAALTLSVAQLTTDASILAKIVGGYTVAISDSGAHISAGLDALQALGGKLANITQNDGAALALTAVQAVSDAVALGKISGSYSVTVSDSSAHIASNLDALQVLFANPNVTFNSLTQTGTLAPLTLSVAQLTTDAGVLAKLSSYTVAISDSSAHIAAGLDALQALLLSNKLAGITQTSPAAPLSISITQLSTDSGALAKIVGSYTLAITDTSANIATNLNALQAVVGKVASVTQASPAAALTLSVAQLTTDASILAKIVGGYTVAISDSGAHISAGLDALQALGGKLANITQNDGAALALTAVQAASDAVALGKISGSYSVTVSDSSAHIASNLDALQVLFANPNVTFNSLTQTGTLAPLTLSVAQLTTDAGVLAKLSSYTVAISDSSAHIAAGLDALQALLLSNKLAGITQTSPAAPLSISITQLSTDSGALAKIAGSYTLAITDTSANIATNLNALQAVVGKVASVTQASPAAALTLSVAQLTTDASILAKIVGGYTVAISDSGAHISAGLDALQALGGKLASITLTDAGTPLAISITQLTSDTAALGKILGGYTLVISDSGVNIAANLDTLQALGGSFTSINQTTITPLLISISQLIADSGVLAKISGVYTLAISDTSANVAANLDTLQTISSKISTITQTGSAVVFNITATQAANDAILLAKITGSYTAVVSDTSANIAANLNALQAMGSKLTSIAQTSIVTPLTLSVGQLTTDTGALAKIVGGYTIAILDSGAHISAGLDALQALGDKLASITQNDSTVLALTAVQAANDAVALGKISGSYSVTISDSSAHIAGNLDALQALGVKLISITQIGTKTAMALTATQVGNDAAALGKISNSYSVAVSDSSAHIASNLDALQSLFTTPNVTFSSITQTGTLAPLTLSVAQLTADAGVLAKLSSYTLTISDTGANIVAGLGTLQGLAGKLVSITQTDTETALALTATQVGSDAGALAKITGGYTAVVTDTSTNIAANLDALQAVVAKLVSINQTSPAALTLSVAQLSTDVAALTKIVGSYTVAISDSGAHISAGLDALQALGVKLASITQNDSTVLALTAVQVANDAVALSKINGSYSVTISDSSAHVASNLDALQSLFTSPNATFSSITQTGTLAPLTLSLAQLASDAGVLAKVSSYTLTISDTGANIVAGLGTLQGLGNKLISIKQTDTGTALALTATQVGSDAGALAKITGGYTAVVTDTSTNISTNLDALQAVVAKLVSINQTSPAALTLSVAQLSTDAAALNKIVGGYTVAISDSGEHISAGLDALQALGVKLASITQNDNTVLALTAVQVANDAVALSKIIGSYNGTVTDTSVNLPNDLATLEQNAWHINNIILSDSTANSTPTLTLTAAQYAQNIDALAEISSPYKLVITGSTGIAPQQAAAFSIRAPEVANGPVTLNVYASFNGAAPVLLGSETTNGNTAVQFMPSGLISQPGDNWMFTVSAASADGSSLGAGQIEMNPGFSGSGSTINQSYASSFTVKFLSVSSAGVVTGLPSTYSSADTAYYILMGSASGDKGISSAALTTAASNQVLLHYINAGRVAVNKVDGIVQADGLNVANKPITVAGVTIPELNNGLDPVQNAIVIGTSTTLTSSKTVQMWMSSASSAPYQVGQQTLSSDHPYSGFGGYDLNQSSSGSQLTAGTYQVFFTDDTGTGGNPGAAISGLKVGLAPTTGGLPSYLATAPSSSATAITLEVGTVAQIEAYTATGATWYLIEDSIQNIQSAQTTSSAPGVLNTLISGNKLLGAYVTGGIAPPGNGYWSGLEPSAINISGTPNYVRVFGNELSTTNANTWQTHSILAVQTTDSGVTHTVQLWDGINPLGSSQSLTSDGSGALAVPLPSGVILTSGDILTATLDGVNPVKIGVVPPGGGLPTGYVPSLTVWTGTVSQLPSSLSLIAANTLYVLQDTAEDLAAFALSPIETGVAQTLAASGNLVFDVTGGQLSVLQQYLIEQNNLPLLNFSPVSINDTFYGLETVPILGVGDTLVAHDNLAHWIFSAPAIEATFPAPITTSVPTDNLANLANSTNLLTNLLLTNDPIVTTAITAFKDITSIVVSDSVANYIAEYTVDSAAIATQLIPYTGNNPIVSYQLTDSLSNLQVYASQLPISGIVFTQVNVIDSVANLELAYTNRSLAALAGLVKTDHLALSITADDTVANLTNLLGNAIESGLYAQFQSITINDSAQNILNALQNGVYTNNGLNVLQAADNIVITDTYANVLAASQADQSPSQGGQSLLEKVSQLNLTSGPSIGSTPLQIGSNNSAGTLGLPEVVLSFMSGDLTATETPDNSNGTLVTISDAYNNTVTFDLRGVSDSSGLYTQGGWYHTGGATSVTGFAYNAANGTLTLSGVNLTTQAEGYNLAYLSLTGDGGLSYALIGGSLVSSASAGSVVIQLSGADQLEVDALLNKNGSQAFDSTAYNLTAKSGWDMATSAISKGITVSNYTAPAITSVMYLNGVLTVTGNHFAAGNINLADLTLTGSAALPLNLASYTVSNLSASGFSVTLAGADLTHVGQFAANSLLLSTTTGWDGDSSTALSNIPVLTAVNGVITNNSQTIFANLNAIENASAQISKIMLTDATVPTLTLTDAQYIANIDVLSEIASPYKLNITPSTNTVALEKIPAFTMRAAAGTIGAVTLAVNVSVTSALGVKAAAVQMGTVTTSGTTPVQFMPQGVNPKAGESWAISITATNAATGAPLPAGQIEMTPGFFGASVTSSYGASANVKFLSVSTSGAVTGLPASYSATDNTYYVLEGSTKDSSALSVPELTAALTSATDPNYAVLLKYIQAGRVAVDTLDGATQPDGAKLSNPAVVINGNTLAVINDNFDSQQGAILVNAAQNVTLQMWLVSNGSANQINSQVLTTAAPYAGFNAPAWLQAGTYSLYFTDSSGINGGPGKAVSGLQTVVSSVLGGVPAQWTAGPTASAPITLEVGSVAQVEQYAQGNPSGTTWYMIRDSIEHIQAAGSGLNSLIASQQLIGATVTDGFTGNNNANPAPIQISGTQNFVRVLSDYGDTGNPRPAYPGLAIQPVDGSSGTPLAAGTYDLQLSYENGTGNHLLGGVQSVSIDGSAAPLTINLPAVSASTIYASGYQSLTASLTLNGGNSSTPVDFVIVPPGGGLPSTTPSLNIWTGSVSQLPSTLSAIHPLTLYIVQDSAFNLLALSTSSVQTGVATALSAAGLLAYEPIGSLTYLQQQLIEHSHLNIASVSPITLSDSLLGLEHVSQLSAGESFAIHADFAHLLYATQANALPVMSSLGISTAISSGQVFWADNWANVLNTGYEAAVLNAVQNNTPIKAITGIVISDTLANYYTFTQPPAQSPYTQLQTLVNNYQLYSGVSYELKDGLIHLQSQSGALLTVFSDFLTGYKNASVDVKIDVVDSASNLEAAATNGNLSALDSSVNVAMGHGIQITAKDTIANLTTLLDNPLYHNVTSHLQNLVVLDTAANIAAALQNGNNFNNSHNPILLADNITVNDSAAKIQAILNGTGPTADPGLLSQVSQLLLTKDTVTGSVLDIQLNPSSGNQSAIAALPEINWSQIKAGATLTAIETEMSNNNGINVAITDGTLVVSVNLVGVTDSSLVAYTQGGWYHS